MIETISILLALIINIFWVIWVIRLISENEKLQSQLDNLYDLLEVYRKDREFWKKQAK